MALKRGKKLLSQHVEAIRFRMQLVCPVNRPDRPSGVDDVEIVSDVGRKAGEHLIELIDHVVDEPCRDGKILTEREVERRLQPGTERDIRGNSLWYGIVAAGVKIGTFGM
jgi:hypothetical protein